jgi:hypothetical protein
MKIYKVTIEKLSFDRGNIIGYNVLGYYANKDKANTVAEEKYRNRNYVTEGKIHIEEIDVEE